MVCSPSGGGEIGDALDGHIGESRQDVSEIVAERDLEPAIENPHPPTRPMGVLDVQCGEARVGELTVSKEKAAR